MRPRVEQADELLFAVGTGVLDEVEQLGVGLGGVGPMAEHPAEVVEVGGVEGRADLVDALEVVGDPSEAGQLVVAVDRGRRVTQARDEVPERRGVAARLRLRDRYRVELVAADLGDRLERPPGAVHVPREVRQPVGAAHGIGQRRARREHRDRVVQDGVVLDDVVVDRDSRDLLVPGRELRELADVLDRVAHP